MTKPVIGVFGGTFDPLHEGHEQIIDAALKQLPIDELLVVPDRAPRHKHPFAHADLRVPALKDILTTDKIKVYEGQHDNDPYSLIKELEAAGKQTIFICGSDTLVGVPTWPRGDEVIGMTSWAVVPRAMSDEDIKLATRWLLTKYVDNPAQLLKDKSRVYLWKLETPALSSTLCKAAPFYRDNLNLTHDLNKIWDIFHGVVWDIIKATPKEVKLQRFEIYTRQGWGSLDHHQDVGSQSFVASFPSISTKSIVRDYVGTERWNYAKEVLRDNGFSLYLERHFFNELVEVKATKLLLPEFSPVEVNALNEFIGLLRETWFELGLDPDHAMPIVHKIYGGGTALGFEVKKEANDLMTNHEVFVERIREFLSARRYRIEGFNNAGHVAYLFIRKGKNE